MRKSPRQRRLEADFRSVEKLAAESSIFSFMASGDPPTRYRLQFDGPSISRDTYGKIQVAGKHEVIVELGASYPRMVPNLLWQTPIFHPNISNNGVVCLGGYGTHWVPSLTLDEMSTMLWDMIRFENFDIQSPYNREAALWARDQKKFAFPLDDRNIRDRVNNPTPNASPFRTSAKRVEEKKEANSRSVFGVIGALASRFRDRERDGQSESIVATLEDQVDQVDQVDDVEIVEPSPAVEIVTAVQSELVDPAEIEIIEDGITFLDSNETETAAESDDTGITFLD